MGNLEERFFSKEHITSITACDERAEGINEVLKGAICKGDYVNRNGSFTKYFFNFDSVYRIAVT